MAAAGARAAATASPGRAAASNAAAAPPISAIRAGKNDPPLPPPARPFARASAAGGGACGVACGARPRSEEHTSEVQSLMRISYAVFCLKKKTLQLLLSTQVLTTINNTYEYTIATHILP